MHCEAPKIPLNTFDGEGTIIVDVIIDAEGKVECLRAMNAHPILQLAAIKAAKQWTFKPIIVNGKAVRYAGHLPLLVSWNMEEVRKQCPSKKEPNN